VDLWPDAAVIEARRMACGDGFAAVLVLTGYPAQLPLGWLEILVGQHARLTVAMHLDGVPAEVAAARLHRRRARLESARSYAAHRGKLDDPATDAAAEDAADLADRIARGETRLLRQAVYLTVYAETEHDLDLACAKVRAAATSALLDVRPATFRQFQGLLACAPLGADAVGASRTVDVEVAAAALPFASADVPGRVTDDAILYGLNLFSGGPVLWDRWAQPNHNSITLATSGAGKSYLTKLEALRQLYNGVQLTIVDPEAEYRPLAEHVGGQVIAPGRAGVRINPLAIPRHAERGELGRRKLFCLTVIETLLGERCGPDDAAAVHTALASLYTEAGISDDPRTWDRPMPSLADLVHLLAAQKQGRALAARLDPYTGPESMFAPGPAPESGPALRVFDLSAVDPELLPVVTLVVLDDIWRSIRADGTRRLIVVDEAWKLLRSGRSAEWMSTLAKSARKRLAGLAVATQDVDDVLDSTLGRTVIGNAATQLVGRQAPQAVDAVADAFALTGAERELTATARTGEMLLLSGGVHVAFQTVASTPEHRLCLTGAESFAHEARP
jgi:type IV secretory pathway VirB4 component